MSSKECFEKSKPCYTSFGRGVIGVSFAFLRAVVFPSETNLVDTTRLPCQSEVHRFVLREVSKYMWNIEKSFVVP
jgi:hypothetical protein